MRPTRVRPVLLAAALAVIVVLAVLWSVGPLARLVGPGALERVRGTLREWPLAPLVVIGGYVVLGFVAAPATLMIGATILLFGPLVGAVYAFTGMLANAVATYGVSRVTAREVVDAWLARRVGSKLALLNRLLERRGFVAIVLMRLTPTPYTLQNVLAGAARIHALSFVIGTAVGIVPVIALMAGVATRYGAWTGDDGFGDVLLSAIAVVAVIAAVGYVTHLAAKHWSSH